MRILFLYILLIVPHYLIAAQNLLLHAWLISADLCTVSREVRRAFGQWSIRRRDKRHFCISNHGKHHISEFSTKTNNILGTRIIYLETETISPFRMVGSSTESCPTTDNPTSTESQNTRSAYTRKSRELGEGEESRWCS